jgi:hypothetical protein
MPIRIMPTTKLPFVVKYISDQSHIARHIKTTANNPTMYAHLSLLLRLFPSFGSMTFLLLLLSKQFYCCLRTTMFLGFTLNLLGVAYDECNFIIFYKLFRSRELYTLPTSSYKNFIRILISVL